MGLAPVSLLNIEDTLKSRALYGRRIVGKGGSVGMIEGGEETGVG